jgi:hypothetical protein
MQEQPGSSAENPGPVSDAAAPADQVRFASPATVKRVKRLYGKGAYGKQGILALTDRSLIFMTASAIEWEVARASIAHLKKPWYGMGSYITFDVDGSFYALAFGQRSGTSSLVSTSDLAIRYGGAIGAQAGAIGDALAVAKLRGAAQLGAQWFTLLRASA